MSEAKQIIVNADLFRIAHMAVGKEATRYYLGGVYVTPREEGGVLMFATNGHCLLGVLDVEGHCDRPAIIRLRKSVRKECVTEVGEIRSLVVDLDQERKKSSAKVVVTTRPGSAHEESTAVAIMDRCEIDATYPDILKVIPKLPDAPGHAAIAPRYLMLFGRVGVELQKLKGSSAAAVVRSAAVHGPALVTFGKDKPAFGVVMPLSNALEDLPDWIPLPPPVEAKATAEAA